MPLPQPTPQSPNVPQAFAQGLKLHEQGRLAEAERLYAAVLAVRPDHFDALQMMGVTDTIAETIDDYVAIAARLANNPAERQALRERMKASAHKVYRDRACITALENFLDRAARSPGANAMSGTPSAA